jgi:MinD superfamily P-loop ATPase
MKDALNGEWFYSKTRMGDFIHAKLGPSGENSGKLVTVLRKRAKLEAEKSNADFLIIDGSPGIGCPVIASITGANYVVLVTEPTVSGIHDLKRIFQLVTHFGIKSGIVINKCDLNSQKTKEIKDFAASNSVDILGEIQYDKEIINAQIAGKSIVEYSEGNTTKSIRKIWERICQA